MDVNHDTGSSGIHRGGLDSSFCRESCCSCQITDVGAAAAAAAAAELAPPVAFVAGGEAIVAPGEPARSERRFWCYDADEREAPRIRSARRSLGARAVTRGDCSTACWRVP